MRKQGPCFHCGVDSTPLWRNGPPEKPVLCNACGSRYRLGKSLENYAPKNFQVIRKKKRKAVPNASDESENITVTSNGCSSVLEDYASSESSTSHNYQIGFPIKQENKDENYPVENWGSLWGFPSRKRSPVAYSSLTTIQRLRRDLHKILRDEDTFDKPFEVPEDDVLIYNVNINKLQIPATEIGLGSILLKFPVSSQDNQQEIEPCSSGISGKVPCLNHAQMASPSQEKGCKDVDGVQSDQDSEDQLEDDDHHGASPTTGAADP